MFRRRRNVPPRPLLTREIREQLGATAPGEKHRTIYDLLKCVHCGGLHEIACPRVKRMRFRQVGGTSHIVEVEFWPSGQWPTDGILWPADLDLPEEEPPEGELSSPEPSQEG